MSSSQQYVSSPVSSPSVSAYPIQSQTQTYTENTQQFEDEDSGDANMEAGVFAKLHHIANVPFNSLSLGPNKLSYNVGRKTHNDIVIKRPYISGTHCTIEKNVSKNLVTIKDSSSNGTYVNGVNLKGAIRILYNNDIIAISPPSRVSHNTTPSPNMMASNNNNNANTPGNNDNNNNNKNMQPQQTTVAIQFSISIPENLRPNTSHNGTTAQDVLFNTKYKYDETEQIGSGTFGSVHKCINKTTGEMFAVKVMDLAKLNGYGLDPEILKDEANLMLKIKNHDNVVKLHDAYFSDKYVRLVLDYMDGGDLFDHVIKDGIYNEVDGKKLMRNILKGLEHAHGKNIAHRDLKPENILISNADHTICKIADWGSAKRATATNKFKTYAGTENYLAPEVFDRKETIQKQGTYTVKVDMWSAGIIMYIIFAKKFPYKTEQFTQANGRPDIDFTHKRLAILSPECLSLMKALLDKDENTRISASDALKHEWFKAS